MVDRLKSRRMHTHNDARLAEPAFPKEGSAYLAGVSFPECCVMPQILKGT
jgi:hypothetical protein